MYACNATVMTSGYARARAARIALRMRNSLSAGFKPGAIVADQYAQYEVLAVAGFNGRYVKVVPFYFNTAEDGTATRHAYPQAIAKWRVAGLYTPFASTEETALLTLTVRSLRNSVEREAERARMAAQEDVLKLSRNTVSRALVHADDNDYCIETAVALIGAGHKLPVVTLEVQVTTTGTITLNGHHNYMALRRLFGATRGEVTDYARVLEALESTDVDDVIELNGCSKIVTAVDSVDIEWPAPVIRQEPLDRYDAERLLRD